MSIKIGNVDLMNEVVDLRYQLLRTQLILQKVLDNNSTIKLSRDDMQKIDDEAFKKLKIQFPELGIEKKGKS